MVTARAWAQPQGHADIAPSRFERIEGDGYFTLDSEWIVPALLGAVPIEGRVLEPAAGRGHLSLELRRAGLDVASFDLHRYADPLAHDIGIGDIRRLASAAERSKGLAKTLEDRDVALQRAERTIEALEARLAEQQKDALGERGVLEEKIAKLTQFEAESAARGYGRGPQSARQDRGARRQEAEAGSNAKDAPSAQDEPLADGTPRSATRGTTPMKLALAWGFVGIPLLWGIYGTQINAMKLFQ